MTVHFSQPTVYYVCFKTVNGTIVRETLRTNNRALAKALERAREELAVRQQALLDSESEKQEIRGELSVLKRVAGLKNDAIDNEVHARMTVSACSFACIFRGRDRLHLRISTN